MLLKKIELSGFKSFAQKTALDFTAPITAIVGPNGSGKSNIAEAIRFVLGEQSMKSLRSKRGEDLLFHGAGSRRSAGQASVAITLDNSAGTFNVDYEEVEIKRTVHRDGTNYYAVNGSRQRLKDILELLATANIGSSSHHIISQGETDRILTASPKDRRVMVEDALGLRVFQYKRAESEKKLVKTRENMVQVETLRREIAPHLAFLKKQVEKIREAEEQREALQALYAEYLFVEQTGIVREKESIANEKKPLERERTEIEQTIREKESSRSTAPEQHLYTKEIADTERKLNTFRTEREELSRALGRIEGRIEFERSHHTREEQDKSLLTIPSTDLKAFNQKIRAIIRTAREKNTPEALLGALEAIQKESDVFLGQYEQSNSPNKKQAAARVREDIAAFERELTTLEEKFASVNRAYSEAEEKLAQLRKEQQEKTVEERTLERELFSVMEQRRSVDSSLEKLATRETMLAAREAEYKEECAEAVRFVGKAVIPHEKSSSEKSSCSNDQAPEKQAERKRAIERAKIKLEEAGTGGTEVLKEYEEVRARDEHLARELEDTGHSAEALENIIDELGEKIDTKFKEGIERINAEFQMLFSDMFGGGTASLSVVALPQKKTGGTEENTEEIPDSEDEEVSDMSDELGLEVSVNLPAKRVKGLQSLSGGERTLTSIALIFAMTQVNPPPFLLLDETDAALDESNSHKYGAMLQRLARRTQFILITHNRETITNASVLYGVTASKDGISRVLSVKLDEAEGMTAS